MLRARRENIAADNSTRRHGVCQAEARNALYDARHIFPPVGGGQQLTSATPGRCIASQCELYLRTGKRLFLHPCHCRPPLQPATSPHSSRTSPPKRGNSHISADPARPADSIQNAPPSPPTIKDKPAGRRQRRAATAEESASDTTEQSPGEAEAKQILGILSRQKRTIATQKPGALTGSVSLIPARLG